MQIGPKRPLGGKKGQIWNIGDLNYIVCPENVFNLQPSRLIFPIYSVTRLRAFHIHRASVADSGYANLTQGR